LKPLRELSWRPLSRSGGQHGAKREPKWRQKLSRNWSEIDPKNGPEMDPEMTPKWSPKSIKARLPNLVIFCIFSKLGQEAAKMGPEGCQDGPEQVKISLI